MKIRLVISAICVMTLMPASAAQDNGPNDEVIATGTLQRDPAMSAYLSGDYQTAAIEFERNAFCALRAERNFASGVESARDSVIQSQVAGDAVSISQPTGGQGGAVVTPPPTINPSATITSNDFDRNDSENKRTCEDRGFQKYMQGLSLVKLGQLEEAKDAFYTATVLRKTIYDAHFRLALLEYQDGNLDKAKKQYRKLKKLHDRCRKCDDKEDMSVQVNYLKNILG